MSKIHPTLREILKNNLDKLEVFECLDEFSDTQKFCNNYGFDIKDACNAILLKSKKPEIFYSLFCILGSEKLDVNHKAKSAMLSKKVSFASKEEAEEVTKQIYGGISPLGLNENIKVFVDENVLTREKIFIGAGNRTTKFFLQPKDLIKLTNSEVLSLTQAASAKACSLRK